MTTTTTTTTTTTAIQRHLLRLLPETQRSASNLCVVAEADLPLGWVRIYDDLAEVVGPADDFLEALVGLQEADDEEVWESLSEKERKEPRQRENCWPAEHFWSSCDGRLFAVRRNDGVRYSAVAEYAGFDTDRFDGVIWAPLARGAIASAFAFADAKVSPPKAEEADFDD